MKITTKFLIGMAVLVVLSPLGLMIPAYFKASGAWGEWGADEMQKLVGYIPNGLAKLSSFWSAPMPDYAFKGWEEKGLSHLSLAYIISAIVGIGIIMLVMVCIGKLLAKKDD